MIIDLSTIRLYNTLQTSGNLYNLANPNSFSIAGVGNVSQDHTTTLFPQTLPYPLALVCAISPNSPFFPSFAGRPFLTGPPCPHLDSLRAFFSFLGILKGAVDV